MKRILLLALVIGLLFAVAAPTVQAQSGIAPLVFKLASNKTFTASTIDTSVSIYGGGTYISSVVIVKDTCLLYRWVDYSWDRGGHWTNIAADTLTYASASTATDTTSELVIKSPTVAKTGFSYGYFRTRMQWAATSQATVTASRKYWNYIVQTR